MIHNRRGVRERATGGLAALAAAAVLLASTPVRAASTSLFGVDTTYELQATYAAAWRLQSPDQRIISSPGSPEIPVPEDFKFPESNNYDDGDRNFDKGAMINNRMTFLGELNFARDDARDDYGAVLRGDAFYDNVYRRSNDNDSRDTLNQTTGDPNYPPEGPINRFTRDARYYSGRRARLLDAYVTGSWYLSDDAALSVRVGQHIAAWGESLFFSGVALAQSPADASKANVPGADVKSILLPVNQISFQLSATQELTLLGQYKLAYKATELSPSGEYLSIADIIGPGAQFIYGLRNPLYLQNLAQTNLLSSDTAQLVQLVADFAHLPTSALTGLTGQLLGSLDQVLPDLNVPTASVQQPGTPPYVNVARGPDIKPSDYGQWGVGLKYQLTPVTNLGFYHLRYHDTNPAPVQNYGSATLLGAPDGTPLLTTTDLGLPVPVTYNVRYFDGIHMSAISFSSTLLGWNVAGEAIYRDGMDVLVSLDSGILGPVPTPTRARIWQGLLSGINTWGPKDLFGRRLWDTFTFVVETGYVDVANVDKACNPYGCGNQMTYSKQSAGIASLAIVSYKNVVEGWDLDVPIFLSSMLKGQSSLLGGFGPLTGVNDHRASIGFTFTYLQSLSLGVNWAGYFGKPNFKSNSYADRDFVGFNIKYSF